jgi:hypothetical protein
MLHYDGWLALPAGLRRQVSLDTADLSEVELVDGAIVLRRADSKPAQIMPAAVELPATSATVAARKRGRPAKAADQPKTQRLRVGGRCRAKPAVRGPSQA